ncbi:MAG: hypothetical protein ACK4ND_10110 [Cytophagaceae bacterium]
MKRLKGLVRYFVKFYLVISILMVQAGVDYLHEHEDDSLCCTDIEQIEEGHSVCQLCQLEFFVNLFFPEVTLSVVQVPTYCVNNIVVNPLFSGFFDSVKNKAPPELAA